MCTREDASPDLMGKALKTVQEIEKWLQNKPSIFKSCL